MKMQLMDNPYLIQALERVDDSMRPQLMDEAVSISSQISSRFYRVFMSGDLQQATYNFIGVASLGLWNLSERDIDSAVDVLKRVGLFPPFKIGLDMITKLHDAEEYLHMMKELSPLDDRDVYMEKQQKRFESELKSLLEVLSGEPGKNWIGLRFFHNKLTHVNFERKQLRFMKYLMSKYANGAQPPKTHDPIYYWLGQLVHTLFLSCLLAGEPRRMLTNKHIEYIIKDIKSHDSFSFDSYIRVSVLNKIKVEDEWKECLIFEIKAFIANWNSKIKHLLELPDQQELANELKSFVITPMDRKIAALFADQDIDLRDAITDLML